MASSSSSAQKSVRAKGSNKCPHHEGREVLYVCEDCDGELACAKCVSTIHKKHAMEELDDVIPQVKMKIQDFVNKVESTYVPELNEKLNNLDGEISNNSARFEGFVVKIKKQNENLKNDLDKITTELTRTCRESEEQNNNILQRHKTELQSKLKELNSRLHELKDTLPLGTGTQLYDVSRGIPNDLTIPTLPPLLDVEFNPTSAVIDKLETLLCDEKRRLRHLTPITALLSFTTVNQQRIASEVPAGKGTDEDRKKRFTPDITKSCFNVSKPTLKKPDTFHLHRVYKQPCEIKRIKSTFNNQFWILKHGEEYEGWMDLKRDCLSLLDHTGKIDCLSLLDHTGKILMTINIEAGSEDFSVSPSTGDILICINDEYNSVRKVKKGDKKCNFMFYTDNVKKLWSICISDDENILLGMEGQIVKYTQRGQILSKYTSTEKSVVYCSFSKCPVTRNIAVVTNVHRDKLEMGLTKFNTGTKSVSILSEDLQMLYRYYGRDIESFNPWDACYSDTGDIYIADYNNRSIQRISGSGEFMQTVYTDGHKMAGNLRVQPDGNIMAVFEGYMSRSTVIIILQKQ